MAIYNRFLVRRLLQHGFQFAILVVGKILLQPFTRVDTYSVKPQNIENRPYIFVSNHRGSLDPFIIGCCLPVGTVFKITPVAFMTKNIFYDSPLRPFLWLAGAYAARSPKGKHKIYGVDGSVELLQNGFSMFIFPEGTRVRGNGRGQAHSGVVRIHSATPNIPIILCHIEYNKGIKSWLTGSRRTVKYRVIKNPNYTDPEKVMDDVYAL